ncbi:hypothetical protein ABZ682_23015 [Streptomyces griseoviridis]|uniref:hypothetical protein n=1 Tax=Streptomyces griseoviridis TaxID=45398 RepID=UPI0033D68713
MNFPTATSTESVTEHGITVIGHDSNAWIVAMICAVIAAFIYEWTMTLTRKITRRIPFLLLKIARKNIRRDLRDDVYDMWEAELADILKNQGRGPLPGLLKGTAFAAGLAFYGARRFMRTKAEAEAAAEARIRLAEATEMTFEERALAELTPEKRGAFVRVAADVLQRIASFLRENRTAIIGLVALALSLVALAANWMGVPDSVLPEAGILLTLTAAGIRAVEQLRGAKRVRK